MAQPQQGTTPFETFDPIIFTPRLKLTLLIKAERGSEELGWLHELRSNPESMWWSIHGTSKTIEDTERVIQNFMPFDSDEEVGKEKSYRINYAVHRINNHRDVSTRHASNKEYDDEGSTYDQSQFVGLVSLVSLGPKALPLPDHLIPSPTAAARANTLQCEIAYSFLPTGWGQGYATESVTAILKACKTVARSYWAPFEKMYVRSIVNETNPKSLRVMQKAGLEFKGVYEWSGEPVWLNERWQTTSRLCIFGLEVVG